MRNRGLTHVLLALVACLAAVAGQLPALAQTVAPNADVISTGWQQPGPDVRWYDGLGTWVYVAPGASSAYEYPMTFVFDHLRTGAVTLGTSATGNVARLSLHDLVTGAVAATDVPYDWSAGRFYFLYVHQLSGDDWGAWVMDWDIGTWTYIGSLTARAGWGQLVNGSLTSVQWSATATPPTSCTGGPATDAYFFPPLGYTGSQFTFSSLEGQNPPAPGGCSAQAEILPNGWVHYHVDG